MKYLLIVALAFATSGCATRSMYVSSYNNPGNYDKTYILLPENEKIAPDDFEFKELSKYVNRGLQAKGYSLGSEQSANLIITINYGTGEPVTTNSNFSIPVYARTSGRLVRSSGYVTGNNGDSAYYSGSSRQEPSYGILGFQNFSNTSTSIPVYLIVTAFGTKENKGNIEFVRLWKTSSIMDSKGDGIRKIIPTLVAGSMDYFGTDTGKLIEVAVSDMSHHDNLRIVDSESYR